MTAAYDAVSRLAEGRPAVDDVAEYVQACRRLGYQHRDLTMHPAQVRDWYDGEDGLDLRVLDSDAASLAAAAAAAEDAARTQADLVTELSWAWAGRGAGAAGEFAWRSGEAAAAVSSAVRAAADAVTTLRDELWRAVDTKVGAVEVIDATHRSRREEWLAAARTVTTGAGDVVTASELVDLQVKPFVDAEIGSTWVAAMRAAAASIGLAYDTAIARSSLGGPAVFDVPGELGPRAEPARHPQPVEGVPSAAAPVMPAAAVGPAPVTAGMPAVPAPPGPSWAGPAPGVSPPVDAMAPATSPAAAPPMPSLGDSGDAPSSLGTGVTGIGQQLADLIGGLIRSPDGPDESLEGEDDPFEEPDEDETDETDEDETADDEDDDEDEDDEADAELTEETAEVDVDEPAPEAVPAPTPVPPPPPETPPAVPEATSEVLSESAEPTPCEIAADELPQVGE